VSLLVSNGFKISKVARFDDDKIKESVIEINKRNTTESDYIDRLILYMLNFDNIGFYNFTNEIIAKKGFEDAVLKVFFALFERIGMYWQVGSIFPAQEHYVTSILRQKLIAETDKLGFENRNGLTFLFFLPDGEMHEMSLLFYSYLAQKYGYNVIYLGQFVPFEDLEKVQTHTKIDYVFTAFINAFPKEDLENYLVKLKDTFQHQKIFITGWQIQHSMPALPRSVKIIQDYKDFKKYLC
jgi:methanogenic corrinoid protein MtbC1